jgi:hypothetical protein
VSRIHPGTIARTLGCVIRAFRRVCF